ncbi:30S ribosomal protein S9 [SAR202 cluster bacterium AD-804-J14_MRT_500m]|nr:30S ribosomal protein S9 [SAR202 cluster bacterium AD-804-J14_MRT_500m]
MAQEHKDKEYYYGTGKRKTSIARVRLYQGQGGSIRINDKAMEEAFPWFIWQNTIKQPLEMTSNLGRFHVVARVKGGGVNSQSEAIRHGIARALVVFDQGLKKPLRDKGLMTRDARIKESKKYGLKRARRAPQYTKR